MPSETAHPLFADFPLDIAVTPDSIHGGEWQGMVPGSCKLEGYFEYLPGDHSQWEEEFIRHIELRSEADDWLVKHLPEVKITERFPAFETEPRDRFVETLQIGFESVTGTPAVIQGFNSGCDAYIRSVYSKSPTVIFGPGSLDHAHCVDEFVPLQELFTCADPGGHDRRVVRSKLHGRSREQGNGAMKFSRSDALFQRSLKTLAGGVSSSARTLEAGNEPHPIFMRIGRGAEMTDVDGNQYVDYLLSFGSLILGHSDPDVQAAVVEQVSRGAVFGTAFELEGQLAELLVDVIPCAEQVRFANTGSDAIASAIRLARTYTGKDKILKFEGHYHGSLDVLYTSCRPTLDQAGPRQRPNSVPHAAGIPAAVTEQVIVAPWNDEEAVAQIIGEHEHELAAIIAEPVVANLGCTMPEAGFLDFLRRESLRCGMVLIFDEVATGFRVALGGAQEHFGVLPDLAVFSKALGGGYPIAAFVGKREIMDLISTGKAKHSGTYNGNPISLAAAFAVVSKLRDEQDSIYPRLCALCTQLIGGMGEITTRAGIAVLAQGLGSMFQIFFTDQKRFKDYRDILRTDMSLFAEIRRALLERGIFVNPGSHAVWFVSTAHTDQHVAQTLKAFDAAVTQIQPQSNQTKIRRR